MGGYSGPGNGKVNILDGIKKRAGEDVKVFYAPGCGRESKEWATVPSNFLGHQADGKTQSGLMAEYFNNVTLDGNPVVSRIDNSVDFSWTLFPPDPKVNLDFYSVRWTGFLKAPNSGNCKIGLDGDDGFRLYINDSLVIDNWKKQTYSALLSNYYFEKNESYKIRIEFFEPDGKCTHQVDMERKASSMTGNKK